MSFGFLNAMMLLGLAGAALPVLVHLLSRRKYDVVNWGAMQFLELGRRTRRRIRLEELLLLLLRIGLVCLLAAALARPWAKGSVFSQFVRSTPRDIGVVIDGSYSMGWEGGNVTPYAAAAQWTHELVEQLQTGDTVTLLDARDRVRMVTDGPMTDFSEVRKRLDALPTPSGTSSLPAAGVKAVQALAAGDHLDRDVILLTDGQSLCWGVDNGAVWRQFDEAVRQSSVPPRVWAVNVAEPLVENSVNFSVDRLSLSRELTVPGFPLKIRATVRQWGGASTQREVSFAINGQRRSEKTTLVTLPADGEATVTFEHRFDHVGSYLVSVMLESDDLPGDDRSDAAVVVESGIPVLLVDGNLKRDPTLRETFFINAALTPSQSDAPWVLANVVDAGGLTAASLEGQRAMFLADVPTLSDAQVELLKEFVTSGGGLVVAPGDRIDAEFYNRSLYADGKGLLPARYGPVKFERDHPLGDVNIGSESLVVPWLTRFKAGSGVDLIEARFAQWWKIEPPADDAVVAARLDTNNPFLVTRNYGDGTVVQLAAPLDSDWSTLPAKNDFVPFVHELVFHLASRVSGHNVETGMPLTLRAEANGTSNEFTFQTPDGRILPAESFGLGAGVRKGLRETELPGVYRAEASKGDIPSEYFVVHSDRRESDLTRLSPPDRKRLSDNDRIQFVSTVDEIVAGMAEEESATELWRMMLLAVLGLLIAEVLLTRRLVQGGHEAIEEVPVT